MALWSEKSTIDKDLFEDLHQKNPTLIFVQKRHRLISAGAPQTPLKATGVCALPVLVGTKRLTHYMGVVPQLCSPFFMGADLLVRLGVQLDTVNQVLWSLAETEDHFLTGEPEHLKSGQAVPHAAQVSSESDVTIPS